MNLGYINNAAFYTTNRTDHKTFYNFFTDSRTMEPCYYNTKPSVFHQMRGYSADCADEGRNNNPRVTQQDDVNWTRGSLSTLLKDAQLHQSYQLAKYPPLEKAMLCFSDNSCQMSKICDTRKQNSYSTRTSTKISSSGSPDNIPKSPPNTIIIPVELPLDETIDYSRRDIEDSTSHSPGFASSMFNSADNAAKASSDTYDYVGLDTNFTDNCCSTHTDGLKLMNFLDSRSNNLYRQIEHTLGTQGVAKNWNSYSATLVDSAYLGNLNNMNTIQGESEVCAFSNRYSLIPTTNLVTPCQVQSIAANYSQSQMAVCGSNNLPVNNTPGTANIQLLRTTNNFVNTDLLQDSSKFKTIENDKKHPRFEYTDQQRALLDDLFVHIRYPTCMQKRALAKRLNITSNQVKIWFQNRRRKDIVDRDRGDQMEDVRNQSDAICKNGNAARENGGQITSSSCYTDTKRRANYQVVQAILKELRSVEHHEEQLKQKRKRDQQGNVPQLLEGNTESVVPDKRPRRELDNTLKGAATESLPLYDIINNAEKTGVKLPRDLVSVLLQKTSKTTTHPDLKNTEILNDLYNVAFDINTVINKNVDSTAWIINPHVGLLDMDGPPNTVAPSYHIKS